MRGGLPGVRDLGSRWAKVAYMEYWVWLGGTLPGVVGMFGRYLTWSSGSG